MPLVRHDFTNARFGLGATTPSSLDLGSGSDTNNINTDINFGRQIINAITAGETRDQVRQNRAQCIGSLALAGSVLAAQICLAAPDNVASHEDPYWTAAQQAIQQRRPDVWAAAQQAGPYWPSGQPFNMTAVRQQICASLAQNGITVNQQACSAPFGTGCTDEGGTCQSNNPITVTVTGAGTQVVQTPPTNQPPTTTPTTTPTLAAGFSSPIMLLALAGAAIYFVMQKRKRGG